MNHALAACIIIIALLVAFVIVLLNSKDARYEATLSSDGAQSMWFEVRTSTVPNAGRGVFTKRAFKKGDVVMSSPLIIFDINELKPGGKLTHYCGNLRVEGKGFLAFDYQGLCNSSNQKEKNNVRATWRIKDDRSEYIALRDIGVGEEILQNYSGAKRIN
jgi:hypothetical protein